jgi:hypothetical protein
MLVIGYTTVLRRWKDKKPEYITKHPLPDPEQLNATIPIEGWEIGLDGKPREPWAAPTAPAAPTATPAAPPTAAAPPASSASAVLDNTRSVKPITVAELIADELPPWA